MNLGGITKNRDNSPKAQVFELSKHYLPALITFPGAPGSPMKRKRKKINFSFGQDLSLAHDIVFFKHVMSVLFVIDLLSDKSQH